MTKKNELAIRIMTKDFRPIDQTDRYSSLQITRSWHGIGRIDLRINRHITKKDGTKVADKLQRGNIIFPHNHLNKAYQIRHKGIELDENGKITENWIILATALKGWFGDCLTIPSVGQSQDSFTADAESVMHHYVNSQAINPHDINNKLPVVAGSNLQRGERVEWQSRYKNLAEEMADIGMLSGLGWNIDMDVDTKEFVFNTLVGRDLTAGQSVNPPAIFSPEFGTLKQLSYVESDLDYKNVAVVAGQGEGAERRIITVGDLDATGLDRRVLFVDARDIEEETDGDPPEPIPIDKIEERLRNRGLQKLAEHQQEIYLEGQTLPKSRLIYGKDYDLGDMVTLQNKEWGVTLDARITEVKEIYEPGKSDIELTFGNNRPDLISKIKQELSGMLGESTR